MQNFAILKTDQLASGEFPEAGGASLGAQGPHVRTARIVGTIALMNAQLLDLITAGYVITQSYRVVQILDVDSMEDLD